MATWQDNFYSDPIATFESVKTAGEIATPVSGTVSEVNETLRDEPIKINNSPYDEGKTAALSISVVFEIIQSGFRLCYLAPWKRFDCYMSLDNDIYLNNVLLH